MSTFIALDRHDMTVSKTVKLEREKEEKADTVGWHQRDAREVGKLLRLGFTEQVWL